MSKFIGRQQVLDKLQRLDKKEKSVLIVVKGRRRIGKTRLIQEYAKGKNLLEFTGLAPQVGITADMQRLEFLRQLNRQTHSPQLKLSDWGDVFDLLTTQINKQLPTVILLDELSWMAKDDPTFVPKLKVWWDTVLQEYPQVKLVLCSSISIWIERNIIQSTAFFGRISLQLHLDELPLNECAQLLRQNGFQGSSYEIYQILAITGGIPWYLEHILKGETAEENIKHLCFAKEGLLTLEFNKIFNDLFNKHATLYKNIIYHLVQGMKTQAKLRELVGIESRSTFSQYIKTLEVSGFVTKHRNWSLSTKKLGKKNIYRLKDNYLRFFLKYIDTHLEKINTDAYDDVSIYQLPGFDAMMGLQIENLLLNNRRQLIQALGLNPTEIAVDNPYRQFPTTRKKGCQIDWLVQTMTQCFYVCEFKFNRQTLGFEVINSTKEKIKNLEIPRGHAVIPVLFHLGEVAQTVRDANYFYRIIDIKEFIESHH